MDLENAFFAKDSNVVKCSYLHEGKPVFENVQIYATGLPSQLSQDLGATILSGLTGIAEPDYRGSMGESLVDIVNFGLVYGITMNYPHRLEVFLRLTSPTCHARKQIETEVMGVLTEADARLAKHLGREGFASIRIVTDHELVPRWTQQAITQQFRAATDREKVFKALCVATGLLQKGQLPDELFDYGQQLKQQLLNQKGPEALKQACEKCQLELNCRKKALLDLVGGKGTPVH
jgi:metal-sulfur cluster biosynthetic enzyme